MKAETVTVDQAAGKLLSAPIFHSSGKKLLAKGHLVNEEDIRLLGMEGHQHVCVAVLEESEVPEEEAALKVATEGACGAMEIHLAAGGRANLVATENACILLDEGVLREINRSGCITIATAPNFSFVTAGQRVATVKTAPFAIPREPFERALTLTKSDGPILQARPIRQPVVAVLYSDPLRAERGRQLFEGIMRTRLERLGACAAFVLCSLEEEMAVARSLSHLLRARPHVVLMASTTAPAGPEDVIGRAMRRVGCQIERFLAPVEPGTLLLLAYAGNTPVIAAPGCFRSPKPNVVDLVLPPLLARYRLTGDEISALGHGGLLM